MRSWTASLGAGPAAAWLLLVLVGWLGSSPASAAQQTAEEVRVVLADGSEIVGLLVGEDDQELHLQTKTQVVRASRDEVVELELLGLDVPVPALQPEGDEGERWVIVRLKDGSMVTGTLRSMDVDTVVVHSGEELVAVPQAGIVAMNLGTFGEVEVSPLPSTVRNQPREAEPEEDQPSVTAQLASLKGSLPDELLLEYAQRRVELVDREGQPIGPEELDYPPEDFEERGSDSYSAWVGGTRLRADGLFRRLDDGLALDWWAARNAKRRSKMGVWISMSVTGATMMVVAATAATVLEGQGASAGDSRARFVPPLWGVGLGVSIVGTGFGLRMAATVSRDYDHELRDLMPREQAWYFVQEHNGALRRELGLPDEEVLDAWGSPVIDAEQEEEP